MSLRTRIGRAVALLALTTLAFAPSRGARAAETTHFFAETGHTVGGAFWQYWQTHGGLAQQGYPLSDEIQERSELDGHIYTVQYFERAVFEHHPENTGPYSVLLAQVGMAAYRRLYGDHPPAQTPNLAGSRYFPQTQHTLGGRFREYWEAHGGLAQQGYPLTAEVHEARPDGKTLTVQYFERAVFEYHPENPPPYDVLLARLGADRFHATYLSRVSEPALALTLGPEVDAGACDTSGSVNGRANPVSVSGGQTLFVTATGFTQAEPLLITLTAPDGRVVATGSDNLAQPGEPYGYPVMTQPTWVPGRWSLTVEGAATHQRSVIFFCVQPPGGLG
ncbi:MAG TPA: hypothetical protein VM536_05115 [Chloroflexia bacterium]|nr:hypothetical protein [Chloroflexia bacterium]